MKMKNVKTRINEDFDGVGFFQCFYRDYDTDYEILFGEADAALLDLFFISKYGEKPCSPFFTNVVSIDQFTDIAYYIHIENWLKVASTLRANYNVTQPINITESTERYRNYARSNTNNSTTEDNKYGFNYDETQETPTAEYTPDTSSTTAGSRSETTNESNAFTRHKTGNSDVDISGLVSKELKLRSNNALLLLIRSDINSLACLGVYEN